jgi:hypothetical protein
MERKAFATAETKESYLVLHILPKWKEREFPKAKTVAVDE